MFVFSFAVSVDCQGWRHAYLVTIQRVKGSKVKQSWSNYRGPPSGPTTAAFGRAGKTAGDFLWQLAVLDHSGFEADGQLGTAPEKNKDA